MNLVNWYLRGMYAGLVDPTLIPFSDEASFHLGGYVNSQNNRYWYAENDMLIPRLPLLDVMVGVCCAMSGTKITGLSSRVK